MSEDFIVKLAVQRGSTHGCNIVEFWRPSVCVGAGGSLVYTIYHIYKWWYGVWYFIFYLPTYLAR
jgi:hypothetical protein